MLSYQAVACLQIVDFTKTNATASSGFKMFQLGTASTKLTSDTSKADENWWHCTILQYFTSLINFELYRVFVPGSGRLARGRSQVTFEALSQSTTEPRICANDLSHLRAVLEILRYASNISKVMAFCMSILRAEKNELLVPSQDLGICVQNLLGQSLREFIQVRSQVRSRYGACKSTGSSSFSDFKWP